MQRKILDICSTLSNDNLFKFLLMEVGYKGLPITTTGTIPFGMFIISREMSTELRKKYWEIIKQLSWDKMEKIVIENERWDVIWSMLFYGDKESGGNQIRELIAKDLNLRGNKENFQRLLRKSPAHFTKASNKTHTDANAAKSVNNRLEKSLSEMDVFLEGIAKSHELPYAPISVRE
jgi:hypothetical protein